MKCAKLGAFLLLFAGAHAFTMASFRPPLFAPRAAPRTLHAARSGISAKEAAALKESLASEFDITHLEALLARYKRTVTYRFKGAIRAMRILEKPIRKDSVIDAKRLMERFYTARAQLWTDVAHYQDKAARCLMEGDRPLALHYSMSAELLRFLDPVAKMASVYLYTAQNDELTKVERFLKAAAIVGPSPEIFARAEALKEKAGNPPPPAPSNQTHAKPASNANTTATATAKPRGRPAKKRDESVNVPTPPK